MSQSISRRSFLYVSGACLAAGTTARPAQARSAGAALPVRAPGAGFTKAVKLNMVRGQMPLRDKFQLLVDLGYDGVELDSPNRFDREEVLAARLETGLTIHGVVDSVHWRDTLSDPDPKVRSRGVAGLETALDDAAAYGATTALLVPAVVNANVSYVDAWQRSQAEIRKVLPKAEALGVKIALENVWNNFLLSGMEFAHYIDQFESEWIGCYFDAGNMVKYGWPVHWVEALGSRILKVDVKDFTRESRNSKGDWSPINEGDTDWPAVVAALEEVGYQGWFTAEVGGGGRERLQDIAARMDAFLKPS